MKSLKAKIFDILFGGPPIVNRDDFNLPLRKLYPTEANRIAVLIEKFVESQIWVQQNDELTISYMLGAENAKDEILRLRGEVKRLEDELMAMREERHDGKG